MSEILLLPKIVRGNKCSNNNDIPSFLSKGKRAFRKRAAWNFNFDVRNIIKIKCEKAKYSSTRFWVFLNVALLKTFRKMVESVCGRVYFLIIFRVV